MNNFRRTLSLLLCLLMLLSLIPAAAFAGEETEGVSPDESNWVEYVEEENSFDWIEPEVYEENDSDFVNQTLEEEYPESINETDDGDYLQSVDESDTEHNTNSAEVSENGAFLNSTGEEQGSELFAAEENVEFATDITERGEDEGEKPVRVEFICDPEDMIITVYALRNEADYYDYVANKPELVFPEENKSYYLFPGEYIYDAEYNGCNVIFHELLTVIPDSDPLGQTVQVNINPFSYSNIVAFASNESVNAPPYPNVNTSYTTDTPYGTVRFISQISSSEYFYSAYWGSWARQAGIECGTASISMALSYIGINRTPDYILSSYSGTTYFCPPDGSWGGTGYSTPSFATAMSNYLTGNGKYSPPIIHFPNGTLTSAGHYAVIIGKISDTQYYIADPAYNLGTITINGNSWSYKGASGSIDQVHQYYNANAEPASREMTTGAGRTIPDGNYIIAHNADTTWHMDIDGTSLPAANNTNVLISGPYTSNPMPCDVWTVTYIGDGGFYKICQMGTDKALDVQDGSTVNGANIQVYNYHDVSAQKWSIGQNTNGYYIQAKCSGLCAEIAGGNLYGGNNIQQWTPNNSAAQSWSFIPYSSNYTVSYNANDGTGAPESQTVQSGVSFVLSSVEPTRACHAFLGWATESTATRAQYRPRASLTVETDTTLYAVWAEGTLSAWSETEPAGIDQSLIETKVQYRIRDKETTTSSTESTMEGWTFDGTRQVWSDYGPWSDWDIDEVSASDSCEVEMTPLYRYYYFYCDTCGLHEPYSGYCDNGHPVYWVSRWSTIPYSQCSYQTYNSSKYYTTSLGDGQRWYFNYENINDTAIGTIETEGGGTVIKQGYRYRTRTLENVYAFYRWTDWSSWTDTEAASSDTREVETRTMYRYLNNTDGGHTPGKTVRENEVEPTYQNDGHYDEVVYCTVCGEELSRTRKTIEKLTYTVTYDANGGTGAPEEQSKTNGTTLTLSSTKPTRPNSSAGSYTVTLNANGGSVTTSTLEATRTTSYSFTNWNTAADGSGANYLSGGSYTADMSVTLYALWNSSTITSAVNLPTPTRDGYTFKGWGTSANASEGVTGSYTPGGDETLWAVWEKTPVMVSGVSIDKPTVILDLNETAQLTATVSPENADNKSVTWSSSNSAVASVSATGLVTGHTAGTAVITVTTIDSDKTASCQVTVKAPLPENAVALSVSSATIQNGSSATVSIILGNESNAEMIQFALLYDSSMLRFVNASAGAILNGNAPTINGEEAGIVYFIWEATTPLTEGGVLVNITFEHIGTASTGETVLNISNGNGDLPELIFMRFDMQGNLVEIPVKINAGTVRIVDYTLGDVNNDGKINVIDANLVRRHAVKLVALEATPQLAADVNHDGKINVIDANLIRRYAVKLISEFPV